MHTPRLASTVTAVAATHRWTGMTYWPEQASEGQRNQLEEVVAKSIRVRALGVLFWPMFLKGPRWRIELAAPRWPER